MKRRSCSSKVAEPSTITTTDVMMCMVLNSPLRSRCTTSWNRQAIISAAVAQIDTQQFESDEKNDERRPFEELTALPWALALRAPLRASASPSGFALIHAGIIADEVSIYLQLHPVSPQRRFVRQAVEVLRGGGVIVYPTDSCYALGCHIGDKAALERIRDIRQTDRNHHFTLVCRDLAEVGKYAIVDNWQYRLLRAHTPGPYTFLLKASRETPRRLKHERRGTIGLRVPDHPVTALLLGELGEPVMSSTLLLPGEDLPRTDAREIYDRSSSTASTSCWTAAIAG